MLYLILIFLAALIVFIGVQIWGASKAGKVDHLEQENPQRAQEGIENAAGDGQAEGIDRDPDHGVSAMESDVHGTKD